MHPAIPAVEFAHHTDSLRIRRPDGKPGSLDAIDFDGVGAKHPVALAQLAFAEQIQVLLGQVRRELIGVVDFVDRAAIVQAQTGWAGGLAVAAPLKYSAAGGSPE